MFESRVVNYTVDSVLNKGIKKVLVSLKEKRETRIAGFAQQRVSLSSSVVSEIKISVSDGERFGEVTRTFEPAEGVTDAVEAAITDMNESETTDGFIPDTIEGGSFYHGCTSPDIDAMKAYFERITSFIETKHPLIKVRVLNFIHTLEKTIYADSAHNNACDEYGYYMIDISMSAADDENSTSLSGTSINMTDLSIAPEDLVALTSTIDATERMLMDKADEVPTGNTVVFAPSCMTMIFFQLFNSQLNDSAMTAGSSKWSSMFGKQVADSSLTVRIAPLDERMCGMPMIDETGKPQKDTTVIEKGILCGTMLSEKTAKKLSLPAGNNAYCYTADPGDKKLNELISDIDSGILVTRLSGASPTLTGDISMVAKGSFIIKNGKISSPCDGICISGNLADAMMKIDGISSELSCNGSSALPYLRISGLKISGDRT